jgi:hypothetical protein
MKTTMVSCDICERTFQLSPSQQFPNTIELATGDYCIDCLAKCVQFAHDNGFGRISCRAIKQDIGAMAHVKQQTTKNNP